jgi:hypothetical protein
MSIFTPEEINIIDKLINNISIEALKEIDINKLDNENIDLYLNILYLNCKDYF